MPKRLLIPVALLLAGGGGYYAYSHRQPAPLILTGIVTTHEVTVSLQTGGRIAELRVAEGDVVTAGQILVVLEPGELRDDRAFYEATAAGVVSQGRESQVALRLQQRLTADQITQAEATMAAIEAQRTAAAAELRQAGITLDRVRAMTGQGVSPMEQLDQARTAQAVAEAKVSSLDRQIEAQRASVALARAGAEQVALRASQVQTNLRQQAAAHAQQAKSEVRLAYTSVQAPIAGVIDVRAARQGEVVTAGQPLLTIVNPDDLWVRADIEETYIDRVRPGDHLTVRLPSGLEREGTVFHRAVDAGFATQRDVSRTKRDVKTFEVRLRVDNADRRLAVGMTVYLVLPVS